MAYVVHTYNLILIYLNHQQACIYLTKMPFNVITC